MRDRRVRVIVPQAASRDANGGTPGLAVASHPRLGLGYAPSGMDAGDLGGGAAAAYTTPPVPPVPPVPRSTSWPPRTSPRQAPVAT